MDGLPNKLISGIIVLVVLVICFGLLYQYMNKSSEKSIDEKCRLSVVSYSNLLTRGFPVRTDQIHCPVKDIVLKGDDSDKRVLAEEMKQCWQNFGKGELSLFEGNHLFCSVCARVSSEKEVKIDNFEQYLRNNVVRGKDYTYLNYLSNFRDVADDAAFDGYKINEIDQFPDSTLKISDADRYGILFIYARGPYAKQYFEAMKDNAVEGLAYVGVGALVVGTGVAVMFIPVVGTVAGPILIAAGNLIHLTGLFKVFIGSFFSKTEEIYSEVVLRPYTNATLLDEIGCTKIPISLIDE